MSAARQFFVGGNFKSVLQTISPSPAQPDFLPLPITHADRLNVLAPSLLSLLTAYSLLLMVSHR